MLKKYWRRFNTILFFVAFFGPWVPSCGTSTVNGFQSTFAVGIGLVEFASNPRDLKEDQFWLFVPIIFIGLICTLLYLLMNLISSLGSAAQIFSRWRAGILLAGTLGMLGSIVWTRFTDLDLKDYRWGYWLTWAGLVSSIGLEIMENQASKTKVPDD